MPPTSNNGTGQRSQPLDFEETTEASTVEASHLDPPSTTKPEVPTATLSQFATRAGTDKFSGANKNKVLLIGGGLLAAVLFFVLTMFVGKSSDKKKVTSPQAHAASQSTAPIGSVTPLMDTVRNPTQSDSGEQLSPADINRTKSSNGVSPSNKPPATIQGTVSPTQQAGGNLGSVPSFGSTQQRWEEPRPYGEASSEPSQQPQQQQNALKEPSLIFVRNLVQNSTPAARTGATESVAPVLDLAPGTRILAKLTAEVSSAVQTPVVAEVQYTYALGDRVVIPAGARFIGHLEQADRSGLVSVKFDEIDLNDVDKIKIEAIGIGVDLRPIKGIVYGKNTGRNFLVRTASGIGSVAAMIVGNNTSSSFSEDDLIRERIAQNVGNAGDSDLMNLAVTNKIVVAVPADTKIYVVFTKREQNTATLHQVKTNP